MNQKERTSLQGRDMCSTGENPFWVHPMLHECKVLCASEGQKLHLPSIFLFLLCLVKTVILSSLLLLGISH